MVTSKEGMSPEASPAQAYVLLDAGVRKPFCNVVHLSLMPQGLHCMVSPQACQDHLHVQQTPPPPLAPAEA